METDIAEKQPTKERYNKGKQWGKPFAKGQSGNPKGRPPKDLTLTSIIKDLLEKPCPHDSSKTWRYALAEQWLEQCYRGNPQLIKELIDRLEGKVVQPLGGEGGGPIRFVIGNGNGNGHKT